MKRPYLLGLVCAYFTVTSGVTVSANAATVAFDPTFEGVARDTPTAESTVWGETPVSNNIVLDSLLRSA